MDLRVYFVVLYLVVDVAYVMWAGKFYEAAVRRIQGSGFPPGRMWAGGLAWAWLALGWALLAAPAATRWMEAGWSPALAGGLAGAIYGLTVYMVYNLTLYVQFQNYGMDVVVRDVAWGTGWAVVLTIGYALATRRFAKKR